MKLTAFVQHNLNKTRVSFLHENSSLNFIERKNTKWAKWGKKKHKSGNKLFAIWPRHVKFKMCLSFIKRKEYFLFFQTSVQKSLFNVEKRKNFSTVFFFFLILFLSFLFFLSRYSKRLDSTWSHMCAHHFTHF